MRFGRAEKFALLGAKHRPLHSLPGGVEMASLRARGSLRRAVAILVRLSEGNGHGVRVAELVEALGVSAATVYRDLKDLERAGVELERTEVNGERRICLPTPGRKPTLRMDERMRRALQLLRDGMLGLQGTFVEDALDALLRSGQPQARTPALRKTGPAASAVDVIARGLEKRQRICFHYRGEADQAETERNVEPLELRVIKDQLSPRVAGCTKTQASSRNVTSEHPRWRV
jgi:predicted DNA-binding transcriptional regulator YafY